MKILLIGANGNIGTRIREEALKRGHEVTAFVRSIQNDLKVEQVKGDAFSKEDIKSAAEGHDLLISAFGPIHNQEEDLLKVTKNLIEVAKETKIRVIALGGAGSLKVSDDTILVDTPEFPQDWKPIALAHKAALELYLSEKIDTITHVSPAAFIYPGERTGKYRVSEDRLVVNENQKSELSFEDYAVAIIDEAENKKYIGKRFALGY